MLSRVTFIVCAAAAVVALSGCSSGNSDQATASKPAETTVQDPAAAKPAAPQVSVDQLVPLQKTEDPAPTDEKSARLPDPDRPIDHEQARTIAATVEGVRSAVWLDFSNMVVMVNGTKYRTMDTIDRVCNGLESLGDTLAVVVNVEDVTATNPDDAAVLSRNCQLPEGERALNQPKRQVDALDPELRKTFREQQSKSQ